MPDPFPLSVTAAPAISHATPVAGAEITVDATAAGKAISRELVGIFFEDISYSADGGLYAELIQNRSFEYSSADYLGFLRM